MSKNYSAKCVFSVDCIVGSWSAWGVCSVVCNGGTKKRTRKVIQEPNFGGAICPVLEETMVCNTDKCRRRGILHSCLPYQMRGSGDFISQSLCQWIWTFHPGQDNAGGKMTFNTHASIDVGGCRDRQAYSPENIVKQANFPCCLLPNFRINTIEQGGSGRNGRRNFQKTRDACCRLFEGQTRGLDALANIGCRISDK